MLHTQTDLCSLGLILYMPGRTLSSVVDRDQYLLPVCVCVCMSVLCFKASSWCWLLLLQVFGSCQAAMFLISLKIVIDLLKLFHTTGKEIVLRTK